MYRNVLMYNLDRVELTPDRGVDKRRARTGGNFFLNY
jgi:hypothetical protein